jgi:hypothetical protein
MTIGRGLPDVSGVVPLLARLCAYSIGVMFGVRKGAKEFLDVTSNDVAGIAAFLEAPAANSLMGLFGLRLSLCNRHPG